MSDTDLTSALIDRITDRATKFLGGVSQVPTIRTLLDAGGYSEEEHRRGWDLLLDLLGYRAPTPGDTTQIRQRTATAELDAWDGPSFDRARAALERSYPVQAAYVFDNLSAKSGTESIAAVRTFLDRVAALRDGTDSARAATHAEDAAAAKLLATRRIVDAAEEQRLRALIAQATSLADLPAVAAPDPSARQNTARALEAWLRDWRETARVLVTRRDHQIRLGLAERRSAKGDSAQAD